jgi:hypothetical protein
MSDILAVLAGGFTLVVVLPLTLGAFWRLR